MAISKIPNALNPYGSISGPTWEPGAPFMPHQRPAALMHSGAGGNKPLEALQANMRRFMGIANPMSYTVASPPTAQDYGGGGGGHSHGGGTTTMGPSGPSIHGYTGGGIPTDLFSQLTGQAPTADNYYAMRDHLGDQNGYPSGLGAPVHPNVSFPTGPAFRGDPGYSDDPFAGASPIVNNLDGMPSHASLLAQQSANDRNAALGLSNTGKSVLGGGSFVPAPLDFKADGGPLIPGQPTLVGERGPEVVVPKQDATVIPNHYLPLLHLMRGDIMKYLNSLR